MLDSPTWIAVGQSLLAGGIAYLGMLLAQAVHGRQRRLTQHRLDIALVAALSASLAVIAISSAAGFPGGVLAVAVLLLLHLGITHWVPPSAPTPEGDPPILLLYQGEQLEDALQAANLTEAEIRRGLRLVGVESMDRVAALVLEESGAVRIFYTDARRPSLWKRNGNGGMSH